MDQARIAELLHPFLAPMTPGRPPDVLSESQLNNISMYIDILLRWNARINLTAVRDEESIVTRHFGESLFAARHLFPRPSPAGASTIHLIDLGSGAGFPSLPLKLWVPEIRVTMIESNHKKAIFLREVVRMLNLESADIFDGRGQDFKRQAHFVTLRAVEKFSEALQIASKMVLPNGKIALLIGEQQIKAAIAGLPNFDWDASRQIPGSDRRILFVGCSTALNM